jgi:hypothetical protein
MLPTIQQDHDTNESFIGVLAPLAGLEKPTNILSHY